MSIYNSEHTGTWHDNNLLASEIINLIYPPGAIYISMNSTSPATLFGGTWEQIQGRFLLATGPCSANTDNSYFGTIKAAGTWNAPAGSTGGEDWHTLSIVEMPSHNHTFQKFLVANATTGGAWCYDNQFSIAIRRNMPDTSSLGTSPSGQTTGSVGTEANLETHMNYTGENGNHNNMPPYLAVYMWQRIS